jgi:hypothetical protein
MNPNWSAEMVADLLSLSYLIVNVGILGVKSRISVKAITVTCYSELNQDNSPGEQQVLGSYIAHKHEDKENALTETGTQVNWAKTF